jgi:hypothetical protein
MQPSLSVTSTRQDNQVFVAGHPIFIFDRTNGEARARLNKTFETTPNIALAAAVLYNNFANTEVWQMAYHLLRNTAFGNDHELAQQLLIDRATYDIRNFEVVMVTHSLVLFKMNQNLESYNTVRHHIKYLLHAISVVWVQEDVQLFGYNPRSFTAFDAAVPDMVNRCLSAYDALIQQHSQRIADNTKNAQVMKSAHEIAHVLRQAVMDTALEHRHLLGLQAA